jgi:hypothetical protein
MSVPTACTWRDQSHLIAITATSTMSVHGAGVRCGRRISRTASTAMNTAAPRSMSDTIDAASDSARP